MTHVIKVELKMILYGDDAMPALQRREMDALVTETKYSAYPK